MRVVVYLLIAVNVLYLAWAGWIDKPAPPPPALKSEPLPQLTLVTEGVTRPLDPAPASSGAAAVTTSASLTDPVTSSPNAASRCVSVGPFTDLAQAARAAALLRDRGLSPQQRAEQGDAWEGYWVSVGGLDSPADENRLMKALDRAGIKDAHAMPESEGGRRVSVGLFSERDRAEKRAQAVKKLGFKAEVTERSQPGTVYWVDMDVSANERSVPTEGLLSLENSGSRLEIRVCPSSEPAPSRPAPAPRDARPAATTADAGVPRPG
ncbi:MAG: SPOR domain-containing protein [Gammaproteobacteria bacterium]